MTNERANSTQSEVTHPELPMVKGIAFVVSGVAFVVVFQAIGLTEWVHSTGLSLMPRGAGGLRSFWRDSGDWLPHLLLFFGWGDVGVEIVKACYKD